MEEISVFAVERILDYTFKNKSLLHEALTLGSASYQRLEFLGDAALGLAFTNHIFLLYPHLDPHRLTILRSANISNERLARVAVFNHLYQFLRHNHHLLDDSVRVFTDAVRPENNAIKLGGSVKAPKVLADLVESLAGAVYVDLNFNLELMWAIFRRLLEPFVTLEDIPVSMLYELCQEKGMEVDSVTVNSNKKTKNVAGEIVQQQETATKLSQTNMMQCDMIDEQFFTEHQIQKLDNLCANKKWPKPSYSQKELGLPPERKFVCSVQIETTEGVFSMEGEEKTKAKAAKQSAASRILRALEHSNYL